MSIMPAPRRRESAPRAGRRRGYLAHGRPAGGPVEDPDLDLVRRVGAGEGPACAALVDRHLPRILGLAGRLLGSRADAEEVAQEVFLRVWQQAGRWRAGEARFSTWLHRVAVNLCQDRLRRRRETSLDAAGDRKSTRLNSSHVRISYAVFCLKKKNQTPSLSFCITKKKKKKKEKKHNKQ